MVKVLSVDNLITRNLSRQDIKFLVIKLSTERTIIFMNTGAAEKSLHSINKLSGGGGLGIRSMRKGGLASQ